MTLRFLLDTNVLSEPLKLQPNQFVVRNLQLYEHDIATAAQVLYELVRGASQMAESNKRKDIFLYIQSFVSLIPILPYDKKAATWHGEETSRLQKLGQTPSFLDAQIAAVAKTNNLILVTRNISDFQNFSDLFVENWFDGENFN